MSSWEMNNSAIARSGITSQAPGSWRANRGLKILVYTLVCVIAFGLFLTAVWGYYGSEKELDTMLSGEWVTDLEWSSFSEKRAEVVEKEYSGTRTNVRVRIDRIAEDGTVTRVVNTLGNSSWLHSYPIVFARYADAGTQDEGYGRFDDTTANEYLSLIQGKSYPDAYAVRLYVVKPLAADDQYAWFLAFSEKFAWVRTYQAVIFSLGGCLFVALGIFSLFLTGHTKKGIRLCRFDRIPFEADLLIFLILLTVSLSLLTVVVNSDSPFQGTSLAGAACLEGTGIFAFAMVLAGTRRVKTHSFGSWFLAVRFLRWIGGLRASSRWIPAFLIILLGLTAVFTAASSAYTVLILAAVLLSTALLYYFWMFAKLQDGIELLHGDVTAKIPLEKTRHMTGSTRKSFAWLNDLSSEMEAAVSTKMKSERLRAELIANVSHDIRTPLTLILTYVDLLKKNPDPEQTAKCVEVLDRQAHRLQKLTEDVLEASKVDSGNVEIHLEKTSVSEIVEQAVGEYREKLDAAGLTVVIDTDHVEPALADGLLLWRVLRNLLSNAAKYSMKGTRVYIDAANQENGQIEIMIRNISREPLNISADELMERFVRGDRSRHTEGSGLGLDIARSLTELMGGTFQLSINGDLFTAAVLLPAYSGEAAAPSWDAGESEKREPGSDAADREDRQTEASLI